MAYTTAQLIAQLKAARDNAVDTLVSVLADPKPSYSIDGESVNWGDYIDRLEGQIEKLEAMLQLKDPGWHQTQMFT